MSTSTLQVIPQARFSGRDKRQLPLGGGIILLIISSIYHLQDAGGSQLGMDGHPLLPGNYYAVTDGGFPPRLHQMVK